MKKIPVALIFLFLSAVAGLAQDAFVSKRWGFTIQPPKGWIQMDKEDFTENLNKIDFSDEALEKVLKDEKRRTLIASYIKSDPQTTPGLIPRFDVSVLAKSPMEFAVFKSQISKSSMSLKTVFPDIVFDQTKEILISGVNSVFITARFTVKTANGEILRVRSRVYAIPFKNYFIQVSLNDGQAAETDATTEYEVMLKSIKLGR